MILISSDLLRYVSLSSLLLTLTFEQAGLLLYAKEFQQFVWEEEWKVLDMPYFYFRKYWIPICWNCNLIFYTFSLFHSGSWQWCITHNFYLGTFVHEIFCLKDIGRRPWKSSKASYYLELLLYLYCLHSSALYMSTLHWLDKFFACLVNSQLSIISTK